MRDWFKHPRIPAALRHHRRPRDDLVAAVRAAPPAHARAVRDGARTPTDAGARPPNSSRLLQPSGTADRQRSNCRWAGAAGVHLGAGDASIGDARARLGADAIIGVSCYGSIERARQRAAEGADYLAFGAFFPSPTKPAAPRARTGVPGEARALGVPVVAIGGITADNARLLVDAGADYLAVISAVFGADDIESATRRLASLFP